MRQTGLFILASIIASQAMAGDNQTWANYQGNAAHTGYVDTTVNYAAIKTLWSRNVPTPENGYLVLGRPTVTKNALYLKVNKHVSGEANPQQMWALNLTDGETLWTRDFNVDNDVSGLTYADNKIYLFQSAPLSNSKRSFATNILVEAYDATNGNPIFSTPATLNYGNWTAQTPVIDHHQLLIGTGTQQISVNADDGTLQWKSGDVYGNNIVATVNQDNVMRSMYDAIALLDRHSGKLLTTIAVADNTGNMMGDTLVWDDKHHTLYGEVDNSDEKSETLVAVDLEQQLVKWRLPMTDSVLQPVLADDMLYFVNQSNAWVSHDKSLLYAVNAVTGNIVWTYPLKNQVETAPIVTNNAIILQTNDDIEFISRDTHELKKSIPIIGSGSLAVANNTLYYTETAFNIGQQEKTGIAAVALN